MFVVGVRCSKSAGSCLGLNQQVHILDAIPRQLAARMGHKIYFITLQCLWHLGSRDR